MGDPTIDELASTMVPGAPPSTSVGAAPPAPGGAPTPVAPATEKPIAAGPMDNRGTMSHIMDTMLGPNVSYTRTPDGQMVRQETPKSGKQMALSLLAAGITGFFAGAGAGRGPNAVGRGAAAGFTAETQKLQGQDQQKRGQADQDFQAKQESQLRQAQVFEATQRAILNTAQAENLGDEGMDKYISTSATALNDAIAKGLRDKQGLTQAEIQKGLQDGTFKFGDNHFMPDGKVPVLGADGKPERNASGGIRYEVTFSHISSGDMGISSGVWSGAAAAGTPGVTGTPAANATMHSSRVNGLVQKTSTVGLMQTLSDAIAKNSGGERVDWNKLVQTPGMNAALLNFQPYLMASGGDPMVALEKMSGQKQNQKTGQAEFNTDAQFAPRVVQALGGMAAIQAYHDHLAAQTKVTEESETRSGKVETTREEAAAKLPYEKDLAVFKSNLELLKQQSGGSGGAIAGLGIQAGDAPETILQKVQQKNPAWATLLQGLANYEVNPASLPTTPRKGVNLLPREDAIGLAKMIDPTYDETLFRSRNDMRRDYTSGKTATGIKSLNQLVHHMNQLSTNSDKIYSTGFTSINAAMHGVQPSFLRGDYTKTKEDAQAVINEMTTLFKGTAGTDQEIKEWRSTFSPNMSHREMNAWMEEGMRLASGRLAAVAGQWQSGMGKTYDFKLVNPETRKILGNLRGGQQVLDAMGISAGGAGGSFDWNKFPKANN